MINSANKTGARNLNVMLMQDVKGQLNRFPLLVGLRDAGHHPQGRQARFRAKMHPVVELDSHNITRDRTVCSFTLKIKWASE